MFYIIFFTFIFYMYIDAYKNEMTYQNKTNKKNNSIKCFKCGHEQTEIEDFDFCHKCLTHL
jgi:ribosomal protein S14